MDKRAILLIGIFLAVLLAGCVQQETPLIKTEAEKASSTIEKTAAPVTQVIYIKHSAETAESLGPYSTPAAGKVFLVVSIEIQNKGYTKFNTNPFYWKLQANNIEYSVASATYTMDDRLELLDVLDGGSVKGKLVFEVPRETTQYSLGYDAMLQKYNFVRIT